MKIIEMRLREIGFVLWGHCQNLLDDPRIMELGRNCSVAAWIFGENM